MKLYIIRHGQSTNNALMDDQSLRVDDPELTQVGHKQAEITADYLANGSNIEELVRRPVDSPQRNGPQPHKITHLYCSAMHRSLQTARPIGAALNIAPEIWLEIHEHGGIWLEKDGVIAGYGGKTRAEIMAEFPDFTLPDAITDQGWWNTEAGKEDAAGSRARAMRVAKALHERAAHEETQDDTVAIVSHGGFIDSLLKALLNMLPGNRYFYAHYNTGITKVDISPDGRVMLRYMNHVSHLPPELVT